MIVKNNYNECITNLACSIRKYFGLDYKHNTLPYIDELLEERKPKNVVTILCDGMGSNILKRNLDKDAFLIKHQLKTITTVFPATTVAATTSMITGLNPVETGMLGWDMYYKDLDKIITTYQNIEKGDTDKKILPEAIAYKEKNMITKSIVEEINEQTSSKGYALLPFDEKAYTSIGEMYERIIELCNSDGKKYIYAYDENPDKTMHVIGSHDQVIKDKIELINNYIEKLSNQVDDTIIFVVADHGHTNVENIHLESYPDIIDCLERNTSLEVRATNFFIKENKKQQFVELFNKYFGNDFELYSKEEIIESKLFGNGKENHIFQDILGDYISIATSNKALLYIGNGEKKSHHAGYTDDEILIPLIVIDTNNLK